MIKGFLYETGGHMIDFLRISKYAGMREDLVQAGGGNSAFKLSSDKMVIKASGCQLADVSEKSGYAVVNPAAIRAAFLDCDDLDKITKEKADKILEDAFIKGTRPSIETFLHSLSGKYSLHTHPIVVNAIGCRKDGTRIFGELFPEALIVPYATPGVELAKAYFRTYREYKQEKDYDPKIVFLMNHGLLVSAETGDEVIALTEGAVKNIEQYLDIDMTAYHAASDLMSLYNDGIIWRVTDSNILTAQKKIGHIWNHAFCPDCVVFLGKNIYEIAGNEINLSEFQAFVESNGVPTVISYKGNLYIHAVSVRNAMDIQSVLSFSAQVMELNAGHECSMLREAEKNFLLNWDAEKYRKSLK